MRPELVPPAECAVSVQSPEVILQSAAVGDRATMQSHADDSLLRARRPYGSAQRKQHRGGLKF